MSAVAVPPTKPFGLRPPIVPPVVTRFDGESGHEREPFHRVLIEDVRRLLTTSKQLRIATPSQAQLLIRLIDQRIQAVLRELTAHRLLATEIMTPALLSTFMGDAFHEEDVLATTYVGLLNDLDEAKALIQAQLPVQNGPLVSSED